MVEMNDKLVSRFMSQQDGINLEAEEQRLLNFAETYAMCDNAIVALNNMRTGKCHIFLGKTAEVLGIGKPGTHLYVDSVFEEEIISCINPDNLVVQQLQELKFFNRMLTPQNVSEGFPWYMEQIISMHDTKGKYYPVIHRIQYFPSEGKQGICYALCVYKLTKESFSHARLIHKLTGEKRRIDISELRSILSNREKQLLQYIQRGLASKEIAGMMGISKNTVDRHRQNIIEKLQVNNTTEACFKAKKLGLID